MSFMFFSQYQQDKVIYKTFFQGVQNGVFVEIGADDGIDKSNTLFFERELGWTGLCIEPRLDAFARLKTNRSCICENFAISNSKGKQAFLSIQGWGKGLSGLIQNYNEHHKHRIRMELDSEAGRESTTQIIQIPTITLSDLLEKHNITEIDYCSIETEGSEFDIIKTINFRKIRIKVLSIENNYEDGRINKYLIDNGFIFEGKVGINDVFSEKEFSNRLINNYKSESEKVKIKMPAVNMNLDDIHEKIRPNILKKIPLENILINKMKPHQLVVPERFDIMAKYIYARARELNINSNWALQLYLDHIRVFNGFDEPDGTGKKGAENFINSFNSILDSIRSDSFDENKSLIPIGQNNILLDGSHRIGACLLYNKEITGLLCDIPAFNYDYLFFKNYKKHVKTGLDSRWLDAMALEYCRIKQSTYIVSVFPSAPANESKIRKILKENGKVVYSKNIDLKGYGPLFLMLQMYSGENWLGNRENGFKGARQKASLCFTQNYPMRIYLFECNQPDQIIEVKNKIRNIFKIGKHSVHINDNHEETLRLAKVFFNQNSILFLNHTRPEIYKRFNALLDYYKNWLGRQNVNSDNFCIDGSSVMAIYGIRESRDLDFLCHGNDDLSTGHPLVACHNDEVHYYETSKDDIIFNPENHFYFNGVKFATLSVIRSMKIKRNEAKDVQDVALINNFLKPDSFLSVNQKKTSLLKIEKQKHPIKIKPAKLINYVYKHTQSAGYAIHKENVTIIWSSKPIGGCDLYYFQDAFSYSKGLPNIKVLGLHEPVVVLPGQYTEEILHFFDYIITSIDTLVMRDSKYIKFFHPAFDSPAGVKSAQILRSIKAVPLWEKKDAVCMISGNKRSMIAGELYSKRVEAAKWFYDNSNIPFDVYGRPPFKQLPNYRGELIPYEEKFHLLSQYKYSLCFENIYDRVWSKGYISEKILHCIMCGTVPIYWGCSNIEKYIPKDCFIDFRRFKNYRELDGFLHQIKDTEYRSYLEHMQAWVKKGNLANYSIYKLYDKLAALTDSALAGKEFEKKPWLTGQSSKHSNFKKQILPLQAVWSFQDLAKPPEKLLLPQQPEIITQLKTNIITGLIFSKNRAMQLDCVLKSFFLHCIDSKNIDLKVLYTTTDQLHEAQYEQLSGSYHNVEFVKEGDFKKDLLMLVAPYAYILFLVDDNIFTCDFFLKDAVKSLEIHSNAIGFSLRLGKNITDSFYPSRKKWIIPEFKKIEEKVLKFDWTSADKNRGFGYPLEVSSSIYRRSDLNSVLKSENFTNPNTLEVILDQRKTGYKKLYNNLLCYEHSVTFCNPVNLVQSAWKNYAGNSRQFSAENLARKYDQGYRIDIQVYSDFSNCAYHQEVEIVFKKNEKNRFQEANSRALAVQTGNHLVSIIILNYNGIAHIQNCLDSIKACTSQPYEIILIDNASTDGSKDILRSLNDVILVENLTNLGCPPARAQALALAGGEYVVFLDNDIIVTPGWLKKLIDHFNNHPDIGILGPLSNFVSGPQLVRNTTYQTVDELNEVALKFYQERKGYLTETSRLVGFCMAIRRSVIEKIGGLDPQFGKFGFEDDDYSWRAKIAGFKIAIAHDVFIHHFGGPQVKGDVVYNKLLKEAWEIFKIKWGLPCELEYGKRFDNTEILRRSFEPLMHFVSLPEKAMIEALIFQQNVKSAPGKTYRKIQPELKFEIFKSKGEPGGWISASVWNKLSQMFNVDLFIETGTYLGDTTSEAAKVFKEVHTIELSHSLYQKARKRFEHQDHVHVHQGDSAQVIAKILPDIKKKALFWLDAHYSGGDTVSGGNAQIGNINTPIICELEIIKQHNRSDSIILIDDIRHFEKINDKGARNSLLIGYPEAGDLKNFIKGIDRDYYFTIIGDIALAYPEKTGVKTSQVLQNCTLSRLFTGDIAELPEVIMAESTLLSIKGSEKTALQELHQNHVFTFAGKFGLGGHYKLWYGLTLLGEQRYEEAYDAFLEAIALGCNHWRVAWYLSKAAKKTSSISIENTTLPVIKEEAREFWYKRDAL